MQCTNEDWMLILNRPIMYLKNEFPYSLSLQYLFGYLGFLLCPKAKTVHRNSWLLLTSTKPHSRVLQALLRTDARRFIRERDYTCRSQMNVWSSKRPIFKQDSCNLLISPSRAWWLDTRGASQALALMPFHNCQKACDITPFQDTTVNHDRHSKWQATCRLQTLGLALLLMLTFLSLLFFLLSLPLSLFLTPSHSPCLSLSPSLSLADLYDETITLLWLPKRHPWLAANSDFVLTIELSAGNLLKPVLWLCKKEHRVLDKHTNLHLRQSSWPICTPTDSQNTHTHHVTQQYVLIKIQTEQTGRVTWRHCEKSLHVNIKRTPQSATF